MTAQLPIFSIITPKYDVIFNIIACLSAIQGLDYPRDRFEVIVVDDGSTTPIGYAVEPFRDGLPLQLVRQRNSGPAVAKNAGAARARGEFLAFTDNDCKPAPNWLRRLADQFIADPEPALGGRVINGLTDNTYSSASHVLLDYLYSYFETRRGRFFTSNNIAVSTAGFLSVGGFHPEIPLAAGKDREFCVRWVGRGRKLVYAPEALVFHAHQMDFRRFWRQHFTYGRGAYYFRELISREGCGDTKLEPLSFYANMKLFPFREKRSSRALSISFLVAVAQVANAAGFFSERVIPPSRRDQLN